MARREESGGRRTAVIVTLALLAFAALAWAAESLSARPSNAPALRVTRNDELLAQFTMEDLEKMPMHRISQFGKQEEGPLLTDVLESAGVDDFTRVVVRGLGVRDDGVLVLSREQAESGVVLDFTNRGTVKVAGPRIGWEERVRDVVELQVE